MQANRDMLYTTYRAATREAIHQADYAAWDLHEIPNTKEHKRKYALELMVGIGLKGFLLDQRDGLLNPVSFGRRMQDEECSWYNWSVYSIEEVKNFISVFHNTSEVSDEDIKELFADQGNTCQAGQVFHSPAVVKIARTRVLVTQYGGYDI